MRASQLISEALMGLPGRPRHPGQRTASGNLSRAASAYQDDRQGLSIRQRIHRLTERQAKDQRAATALGRLVLKGKISEVEYVAGEAWRDAARAYLRAIRAPSPVLLNSESTGRPPEAITAEYEDWNSRTVAKFEEFTAALKATQERHRGMNLRAALDRIVLEDIDAPHLVQPLRFALLGLALKMGWRAPGG